MLEGRVHRFGDDVNTDEIIPARYLNTSDPQELAKHVMEDADPDFPCRVKAGDVIVAGRNFGCGSSREHAPIAIKAAGVSCVVAASFARIFFRNAINIGLPIIEQPELAAAATDGDTLRINLEEGYALLGERRFEFPRYPAELQEIIRAGGLVEHVRRRLAGR